MYVPTAVNACLSPTVALSDAAIYAPTYLTDDVIGKSIPVGANQNDILTALKTGGVTKFMGDVIRIKKITNNVKSVLTDFNLFNGRADNYHLNANQGRLVGLMLSLKWNSDISLNVFELSFQADMPCPDMKFYLYSSESSEPVNFTIGETTTPYIPFNYTQVNGSVQALTIPVPVPSDNGVYYLCYFEADMGTAQSIKKTLNYVNVPNCTTCNENYYTQFMKRVKYLNVQPFWVDSNNLNGDLLFNTNLVNYTDFNNWGMNFKASVNCDISAFICRNKAMFYDALSMRFALDILGYILMNVRSNGVLEQIKDGIIFLRDGDKTNGTLGLQSKYEEVIAALNVDLSGFNELCLPCVDNARVKKAYLG